jgi:Pentapeptide repeats (8 copies)
MIRKMTCSADSKLMRGVAPALLAVALIGAKLMGANLLGANLLGANLLGASKAMAGELADGSSGITALVPSATPAATPTRGLVSAPVELKAEPALPAAEEPRKVERSALRSRRVKRDEDRGGRGGGSRHVREASAERPSLRARYEAIPTAWRRAAMGLILGVGF